MAPNSIANLALWLCSMVIPYVLCTYTSVALVMDSHVTVKDLSIFIISKTLKGFLGYKDLCWWSLTTVGPGLLCRHNLKHNR